MKNTITIHNVLFIVCCLFLSSSICFAQTAVDKEDYLQRWDYGEFTIFANEYGENVLYGDEGLKYEVPGGFDLNNPYNYKGDGNYRLMSFDKDSQVVTILGSSGVSYINNVTSMQASLETAVIEQYSNLYTITKDNSLTEVASNVRSETWRILNDGGFDAFSSRVVSISNNGTNDVVVTDFEDITSVTHDTIESLGTPSDVWMVDAANNGTQDSVLLTVDGQLKSIVNDGLQTVTNTYDGYLTSQVQDKKGNIYAFVKDDMQGTQTLVSLSDGQTNAINTELIGLSVTKYGDETYVTAENNMQMTTDLFSIDDIGDVNQITSLDYNKNYYIDVISNENIVLTGREKSFNDNEGPGMDPVDLFLVENLRFDVQSDGGIDIQLEDAYGHVFDTQTHTLTMQNSSDFVPQDEYLMITDNQDGTVSITLDPENYTYTEVGEEKRLLINGYMNSADAFFEPSIDHGQLTFDSFDSYDSETGDIRKDASGLQDPWSYTNDHTWYDEGTGYLVMEAPGDGTIYDEQTGTVSFDIDSVMGGGGDYEPSVEEILYKAFNVSLGDGNITILNEGVTINEGDQTITWDMPTVDVPNDPSKLPSFLTIDAQNSDETSTRLVMSLSEQVESVSADGTVSGFEPDPVVEAFSDVSVIDGIVNIDLTNNGTWYNEQDSELVIDLTQYDDNPTLQAAIIAEVQAEIAEAEAENKEPEMIYDIENNMIKMLVDTNDPGFSYDGTTLTFEDGGGDDYDPNMDGGDYNPDYQNTQTQLVVVDAATGNQKIISEDANIYKQFSGEKIIVYQNLDDSDKNSLYIHNIDTDETMLIGDQNILNVLGIETDPNTGEESLIYVVNEMYGNSLYKNGQLISDDVKQSIALPNGGYLYVTGDYDSEQTLTIIDGEGNFVRQITQPAGADIFVGGGDTPELIMWKDPQTGETFRLDLDNPGSDPTIIRTGNPEYAMLNPQVVDNNTILFNGGDEYGQPQILELNLTTNEVTQKTFDPDGVKLSTQVEMNGKLFIAASTESFGDYYNEDNNEINDLEAVLFNYFENQLGNGQITLLTEYSEENGLTVSTENNTITWNMDGAQIPEYLQGFVTDNGDGTVTYHVSQDISISEEGGNYVFGGTEPDPFVEAFAGVFINQGTVLIDTSNAWTDYIDGNIVVDGELLYANNESLYNELMDASSDDLFYDSGKDQFVMTGSPEMSYDDVAKELTWTENFGPDVYEPTPAEILQQVLFTKGDFEAGFVSGNINLKKDDDYYTLDTDENTLTFTPAQAPDPNDLPDFVTNNGDGSYTVNLNMIEPDLVIDLVGEEYIFNGMGEDNIAFDLVNVDVINGEMTISLDPASQEYITVDNGEYTEGMIQIDSSTYTQETITAMLAEAASEDGYLKQDDVNPDIFYMELPPDITYDDVAGEVSFDANMYFDGGDGGGDYYDDYQPTLGEIVQEILYTESGFQSPMVGDGNVYLIDNGGFTIDTEAKTLTFTPSEQPDPNDLPEFVIDNEDGTFTVDFSMLDMNNEMAIQFIPGEGEDFGQYVFTNNDENPENPNEYLVEPRTFESLLNAEIVNGQIVITLDTENGQSYHPYEYEGYNGIRVRIDTDGFPQETIDALRNETYIPERGVFEDSNYPGVFYLELPPESQGLFYDENNNTISFASDLYFQRDDGGGDSGYTSEKGRLYYVDPATKDLVEVYLPEGYELQQVQWSSKDNSFILGKVKKNDGSSESYLFKLTEDNGDFTFLISNDPIGIEFDAFIEDGDNIFMADIYDTGESFVWDTVTNILSMGGVLNLQNAKADFEVATNDDGEIEFLYWKEDNGETRENKILLELVEGELIEVRLDEYVGADYDVDTSKLTFYDNSFNDIIAVNLNDAQGDDFVYLLDGAGQVKELNELADIYTALIGQEGLNFIASDESEWSWLSTDSIYAMLTPEELLVYEELAYGDWMMLGDGSTLYKTGSGFLEGPSPLGGGVPEPSTVVLILLGLFGMLWRVRKRS